MGDPSAVRSKGGIEGLRTLNISDSTKPDMTFPNPCYYWDGDAEESSRSLAFS